MTATTERTLSAGPYSRTIAIAAPPERVFDLIADPEGVRGWWTELAEGSTDGSELRLRFEGLDEQIVMRVDQRRRPRLVRWSCREHSGCPAWNGSTISFALRPEGNGAELRLLHDGVPAELVEKGWERFLNSLAALAEHGTGMPFAVSAS